MVNLGMPSAPIATLAPRRKSRQLKVGSVLVGGDAPVSVQSMCTTLTSDVNATLQQIAELTASGCQIVRVAVPSQDDADALAQIAKKSQIPVIADIHFQPKYIFAAIDAGCAAVRVNPGNIKQFDDKVKEVAKAAGDGYTVLMGQSTSIVIAPQLMQKLPYDTIKDLKPVTLVAEVPNLLVINPNVPAKTVKELIDLAKAKPEYLNFGSSGIL